MRHRQFCVLIVCLWAVSAVVFAAPGFLVNPTKGFDTDVTVKVPAMKVVKTTAGGNQVVGLAMENTTLTMEQGMPELPVMSALAMVAPDKNPQVQVLKGQFQVIDLPARVMPSKGPLTRNVDPKSVPFSFSDAYNQDAWIPADNKLVTIEEPFMFREVRGVRLVVSPVQYNPAKNQIRLYKSFRVKVTNSQPNRGPVAKAKAISPTFEPMYEKYFINFRQSASRLPRLNENGRLLIISPDEFADAVAPLLVWKMKIGIDAKIVKVSEIATPITTAAVKALIQKEYDAGNLVHVILVGDAAQIPTLKGVKEAADSDPCYVKLAGTDEIPDAMISRISATTPTDVAYQVAKFINYEQFPSTGADAAWYLKGMGIASNQGNPTDAARADELRAVLLKSRFTSVDQIYDGKAVETTTSGGSTGGYNGYPPMGPGFPGGFGGYPHLPPLPDMVMAPYENGTGWTPGGSTPTPVEATKGATKAMITAGVNEGRSLINYIGHGADLYWVTTGFNCQDARALKNGLKLPYIIDVACVNGSFVKNAECFAEAFMRAGTIENPAGAIGMCAATTNMEWVPPCIVQTEMSSVYIVKNEYKTAGGILMNGIMKGLEQYGTEPKGSGVMMAEQWHLFGDSSLVVRTNVPVPVKAEAKATRADGVATVQTVVLSADGSPLKEARVTVYNEGLKTMASALTNAEGKVSITVSSTDDTQLYYSVSGLDLIPMIDQKLTF